MVFQRELTPGALLLVLGAGVVRAQGGPSEQGIRIDDQRTIAKCGACHPRDANGMMRRISYIRTTPEIWEQAIKRMIRLNGLTATPQEVRDIVRYLSNNNGLAPEEMKPAFYEVEHRSDGQVDDHVTNKAVEHTCTYCHNVGRVLSQRRTRDDYDKLVAMHIGLFPGVENGVFRPIRPAPVPVEASPARVIDGGAGQPTVEQPRASASVPANAKYPVDVAVDYLATAQPLITPEWTAWRAAMRPAKLAGTWLLTGYQPGRGKVYGQVVVTPGSADDQFTTNVQLSYADTGTTVKLTGRSIVYTGYSWRGRSTSGSAGSGNAPASSIPTEWREALMVSRDGNSMDGRWFWGGYSEFGIDAHLIRLGTEPVVLGTDAYALQSPSRHEVKIYGGNLPSRLNPADVDLGPGVTVARVVNASPSVATVEVDVAKGLPVGKRNVSIGRATAVDAVAIYEKVSYIEVTPKAKMARLGGLKYPKRFAQFEVIAYADGPDGKSHTADDVALGPVSAKWSIEEFYSTPDDDDIKFVGAIDDSGLFTPNVEGPNPNRKSRMGGASFGTNNYGDVWATASFTSPDGTVLRARSYLVVTIPLYTFYDQPEVVQ
jgi:quinohemoprotein amine dehydrogenase